METKWLTITVFLVCATAAAAEKARYDNYRVYSVKVENEKQLEVLQELENNEHGVMFMKSPTIAQKSAEIIIPPHKLAHLTDIFNKCGMKSSITVDDLQK